MILALINFSLAADINKYPLVGEWEATGDRPVVIRLPPEWAAVWGAEMNRSLNVVDADGKPIPYATLISDGVNEETAQESWLRPIDLRTWEIPRFVRPVEALKLVLSGRDYACRAEVGVQQGEDWVYSNGGIVWGHGSDIAVQRVAAPPSYGPYRVRLSPLVGSCSHLSEVVGLRSPPLPFPMEEELMPAPEVELTEQGNARYTLHFPATREVRFIRFQVDGDIFERQVRIGTVNNLNESATIRRIRLEGTQLDAVEVGPISIKTQDLVIEIATERGEILPVTGFTVRSTAGGLVLRQGGHGQIYAGATEPEDAYDLEIALPELLAHGAQFGSISHIVPNTAWLPPPSREGIDGPGMELETLSQTYQRLVSGLPGWVRVNLDESILAHSAPGLEDLRVVDTANRQIPYLIRKSQENSALQKLAFTVEERKGETQIRVDLGKTGAPVQQVVIETERNVFLRNVQILRDRGTVTETLRNVSWNGTERGRRLVLDIYDSLGETMLIRIQNDANPPLTITSINVSRPTSSILFRLPDGGARLLYGSRKSEKPFYDLNLLEDTILKMPVGEATLGPELLMDGPSLSMVDKGASLLALGVLSLGLVGLTWRVLRGAEAMKDAESGTAG